MTGEAWQLEADVLNELDGYPDPENGIEFVGGYGYTNPVTYLRRTDPAKVAEPRARIYWDTEQGQWACEFMGETLWHDTLPEAHGQGTALVRVWLIALDAMESLG